MGILQVVAVGGQRVAGGAAFRAHHFQKRLEVCEAQISHGVPPFPFAADNQGSLTLSVGILTSTARGVGST